MRRTILGSFLLARGVKGQGSEASPVILTAEKGKAMGKRDEGRENGSQIPRLPQGQTSLRPLLNVSSTLLLLGRQRADFQQGLVQVLGSQEVAMVTLSKRATQEQQHIMKVVQGAVKNVADHHPEYHLTERMARSIAKRAAGTLTAPDKAKKRGPVLAAQSPSESQSSHLLEGDGGPSQVGQAASGEPSHRVMAGATGGGRLISRRRSPLQLIHIDLGLMAGWARKAGHATRAAAFEDALRIVARYMKAIK